MFLESTLSTSYSAWGSTEKQGHYLAHQNWRLYEKKKINDKTDEDNYSMKSSE